MVEQSAGAQACNLSAWEAEAGGLPKVQDQGLQSTFWDTLSYILRPYFYLTLFIFMYLGVFCVHALVCVCVYTQCMYNAV